MLHLRNPNFKQSVATSPALAHLPHSPFACQAQLEPRDHTQAWSILLPHADSGRQRLSPVLHNRSQNGNSLKHLNRQDHKILLGTPERETALVTTSGHMASQEEIPHPFLLPMVSSESLSSFLLHSTVSGLWERGPRSPGSPPSGATGSYMVPSLQVSGFHSHSGEGS